MKRSTGFRSLNHHIHGHAEDIAEQAGVPKALVYQVVCLDAAEADIIPLVDVLGRMLPQHESQWSEAQACDVVVLCHQKADAKRYWLREYNELGIAEKVWYGKPKDDEGRQG